ncbi:MAG: hypothetical protein IJB89_00535 [Akkermansia sp.]|nr:hypothetical protein [Akkermansia sp.]
MKTLFVIGFIAIPIGWLLMQLGIEPLATYTMFVGVGAITLPMFLFSLFK